MAKVAPFPMAEVPDPDKLTPQSPAEFAERGWLYFSRQQLDAARTDLEKAVEMENSLDNFYTLGLILRAQGNNSRALQCFEQALSLTADIRDAQRATMLRRLILGQINMIQTGDWNLEKEVWKRVR